MTYKDYNVPRGTIEKYIELLLQWNKKINLVSIKNKEELINRHILDSLQLVEYIDDNEVVFDIGSGAGFPGLLLSYAGIKRVNLVEKIRKKTNFLTLAASLSTNSVMIHNIAVEDIKIDKCDIITARGFAGLDKLLSLTESIAQKNTRYVLLKGKNIEEEIKKALENWTFKYILNQSKTSEEGYILILEQVKRNE